MCLGGYVIKQMGQFVEDRAIAFAPAYIFQIGQQLQQRRDGGAVLPCLQQMPPIHALLLLVHEALQGIANFLPAIAIESGSRNERPDAGDKVPRILWLDLSSPIHAATQSIPGAPWRNPLEKCAAG